MKEQAHNSPAALLKRIEEIERENTRLKSLLLTDELTGLYNRRFFSAQLEVEMSRTRRTGQSCTLIMMDVDHFKSVNDTLGHDAGDRLLTQLGGIMGQNLRPIDFACRFGGDEFAIIMPAADLDDGIGIAKRIQTSMEPLLSQLQRHIAQPISASFGIAAYEPSSSMSVDELFKRADSELYKAKNAGKNQISWSSAHRTEKVAVSVAEKAALSQLIANCS